MAFCQQHAGRCHHSRPPAFCAFGQHRTSQPVHRLPLHHGEGHKLADSASCTLLCRFVSSYQDQGRHEGLLVCAESMIITCSFSQLDRHYYHVMSSSGYCVGCQRQSRNCNFQIVCAKKKVRFQVQLDKVVFCCIIHLLPSVNINDWTSSCLSLSSSADFSRSSKQFKWGLLPHIV